MLSCRPPEKTPAVPTPTPQNAEPAEEYVLVDIKSDRLELRHEGKAVDTFDNIAIGVAGAGIKRKRGDGVTPYGSFRITSINRASKFHIFIGLNYPTTEYATRGLAAGVISQKEFDDITAAEREHRLPPQNTTLGGWIGIHGIGQGSLEIHKTVNWTDGCVALTNRQIEDLVKLVRPGMLVIIR